MRILIIVAFALACTLLSAQKGTFRGTVFEEATGETLPGVQVVIDGTTIGTVTDLDGKFNLVVDPGVYNINVMFISFKTHKFQGVTINADEVKVLDDVLLVEDVEEIEGVKVTATRVKNNENAMIAMKRKSSNLFDGISAAALKRTGDSDAASSVKRVPGISVQGGKYVYIRGLGDRYTKTTLNGMDIPGLDPDRNTVQMDLFPTNVIDNIVVHKSFNAELPADFTGGLVDIGLKDFPDSKIGSVSASVGYNPSFHLQSDYVTYEGSGTDFLGFDNGNRDIPATENVPQYASVIGNPNGSSGQRYQEILAGFNPTMSTMRQNSGLDFGFGIDFGNQIVKEDVTLGYIFALSYKNSTEFYEDAEYGKYGLDVPTIIEMDQRESQVGALGINNSMVSALAGFAVKTKASKYRFNLLHIQNGEKKAGYFDFVNSDQGAIFVGVQHNLEFVQRSLTNAVISGKHSLLDQGWTIDWGLSPTISSVEDPDIRFVRYEDRGNGNFSISSEAGFPERIWRDLFEINLSVKANAVKEFAFMTNKSKLKFGLAYTGKNRDYSIRSFLINPRIADGDALTGDPAELFQQDNLWPVNGNAALGTTYDVSFVPNNPNQFESVVHNVGGYVASDLVFSKALKVNVGLRVENYLQLYTGTNQLSTRVLNKDKVLNDLDFFPTISVNYAISELWNLRGSYSKTIARPSLKELSFAEIYDPLTGRYFIGSLFEDRDPITGQQIWDGDLQSSDIYNYDLRLEYLRSNDQVYSVSLFYKQFFNPIEIIQYATLPGAFQPRNVGDGQVIGLEFELRQNLKFISEKLNVLNFNTNVTITNSEIKLNPVELNSRRDNARVGQEIADTRDMAGQAPYIVNAGLSFKSKKESGFGESLESGLFYNVQGPTLLYVGIVDRPDIYTLPFHSLNFTASKKIGKWKLGVKASNLLGDNKEEVFQSFNAEDRYFTRLNPGFSFSFSLGYDLF